MRRQVWFLAALLMLISLGASAQKKKTAAAGGKQFQVYAVGFYNQENLFDTCHDAGKNDYEYLPAKGWNGMKSVSYTHLTLPTNHDMCRSRWSPYH